MNAETITLITRPYQEIVDDVLTAIVGGVTNEPIFFDVKADRYPLARPARDVRGITGTVGGRHFTFRKEAAAAGRGARAAEERDADLAKQTPSGTPPETVQS